ncbi:MAG: hypothetical protein ABEJ82_01870 [Haloplanus sp.]
MLPELSAMLPELVELLAFGVGTVALSVAGFSIEQFAMTSLQSGQPKLGAWAGFVGLVTLAFAVLLATDKFHPRLTAVRARLAERAD